MTKQIYHTEQISTEPNSDRTAVDVVVMWHGDDGMDCPVRVDCPNGLYPNRDENGVRIYENTHFRTEEEAWNNITQNALAWVDFAGRAVEHYKLKLQEANSEAGKAAELIHRINKNKITKRINMNDSTEV